jgi:hypothetical protein
MSTLPLYPIGGYPGETDVAKASQRCALLLIVVILLMFADLGSENEGNCTFEFFIQLIVLFASGVFISANK